MNSIEFQIWPKHKLIFSWEVIIAGKTQLQINKNLKKKHFEYIFNKCFSKTLTIHFFSKTLFNICFIYLFFIFLFTFFIFSSIFHLFYFIFFTFYSKHLFKKYFTKLSLFTYLKSHPINSIIKSGSLMPSCTSFSYSLWNKSRDLPPYVLSLYNLRTYALYIFIYIRIVKYRT